MDCNSRILTVIFLIILSYTVYRVGKKFEGAGLGLYISKQLVDLMKGKIEIQSTLGKGSTFSFWIPFIKAEEIKKEETQKDPLKKSIRHLNILVAEDNPVNQKFIERILAKQGYKVRIAKDGSEVLRILDESINSSQFDIILMDIQMPEVDGLTAAKIIRGKNNYYSQLPIIALTANSMENQVQEYLEGGMNACVTKPIAVQELLDTIIRVSS